MPPAAEKSTPKSVNSDSDEPNDRCLFCAWPCTSITSIEVSSAKATGDNTLLITSAKGDNK